MRRMSACRQLLTGTSMRRYLPPIGTAGLERVAVRGNRREPWPPPRMIASVSPAMNMAQVQRPSRLGFRARPPNRERGARSRPIAFCLNAAVVEFDEPLCQRQPDAQAVARLAGWIVGLHEHLENVRQRGRRDADAGIAHTDDHVTFVHGGAQRDASAAWRVL